MYLLTPLENSYEFCTYNFNINENNNGNQNDLIKTPCQN